MRPINFEYFDWLCSLVHPEEQELYWDEVLWRLQGTEFVYRHPKDVNREYDGLALRDEFWAVFGASRGISERDMDVLDRILGGCTLLEMLIALARRGENDIMHDPELGDRSPKWFWMMLENLDLGQFAYKGALDIVQNREKFDEITGCFLERKYPKTSRGTIFVSKNDKIDLRRVELWGQMCMFFEQFF